MGVGKSAIADISALVGDSKNFSSVCRVVWQGCLLKRRALVPRIAMVLTLALCGDSVSVDNEA